MGLLASSSATSPREIQFIRASDVYRSWPFRFVTRYNSLASLANSTQHAGTSCQGQLYRCETVATHFCSGHFTFETNWLQRTMTFLLPSYFADDSLVFISNVFDLCFCRMFGECFRENSWSSCFRLRSSSISSLEIRQTTRGTSIRCKVPGVSLISVDYDKSDIGTVQD